MKLLIKIFFLCSLSFFVFADEKEKSLPLKKIKKILNAKKYKHRYSALIKKRNLTDLSASMLNKEILLIDEVWHSANQGGKTLFGTSKLFTLKNKKVINGIVERCEKDKLHIQEEGFVQEDSKIIIPMSKIITEDFIELVLLNKYPKKEVYEGLVLFCRLKNKPFLCKKYIKEAIQRGIPRKRLKQNILWTEKKISKILSDAWLIANKIIISYKKQHSEKTLSQLRILFYMLPVEELRNLNKKLYIKKGHDLALIAAKSHKKFKVSCQHCNGKKVLNCSKCKGIRGRWQCKTCQGGGLLRCSYCKTKRNYNVVVSFYQRRVK